MEEFYIPQQLFYLARNHDNGIIEYCMRSLSPSGLPRAVSLFTELGDATEYGVQQGLQPVALGLGEELKTFLQKVLATGVHHAAIDPFKKTYVIEIKDIISQIKV